MPHDLTYMYVLKKKNKAKLIETESRTIIFQVSDQVGQMLHIYNHKMNKFQETKLQNGDHSYQYCIIYLNVAKRMDIGDLTYKKQTKMVTM